MHVDPPPLRSRAFLPESLDARVPPVEGDVNVEEQTVQVKLVNCTVALIERVHIFMQREVTNASVSRFK